MKHPVWILNSTLLILLIAICSFIAFSGQKPPAREDIEPSSASKPLKGEIVKVNIEKIYENDIFGTYKKEFTIAASDGIPTIPDAPTPKTVSVPQVPKPQFLDPLDITLKGIIIMLEDDSQNRAIIADNKTKVESTFGLGKILEDAQLIRIFSNKVIFLRSNGQQEVLYLREKDAKADSAYIAVQNDWQDISQKVSDTEFVVSPQEFITHIKNLAQCIDMLDLITVYNKGKSVGCKIGSSANTPLLEQLGLKVGDIITQVNATSAADTADRFKIYKEIIGMGQQGTVKVKLLRQKQEITIIYSLKEFKPKSLEKPAAASATATPMQIEQPANQAKTEQLRSLQQRRTFAPTLQEIRAQERANMLQNGKSSSAIKNKTDNIK
ncbi:MAG: hypothetical protein NTX86_05705 [Candidatus Dependentiae bacterium]|nr:hypothetical protein [Candidatus Dependentiae bacterium]